MRLRGLSIVLLLLGGCAPLRPRPPARKVSLAPVRDFAGAPGSGQRMRARVAARLRLAGLSLSDHGGQRIALVTLTDYAKEKALMVFDYPIPPSQPTVEKWASAHVSLTARLVDVKTGEVYWVASSSSRPDAFNSALDYTYRLTIEEAEDQAAARLVDQIVEKLQEP